MSSPSLALQRRAGGFTAQRGEVRLLARVVLAAGATLIVAAVVLFVLIARSDTVPSHYHDWALGRVIVRSASSAAMLLIGTLLLARVPRHPMGWLLCAPALGLALSDA